MTSVANDLLTSDADRRMMDSAIGARSAAQPRGGLCGDNIGHG